VIWGGLNQNYSVHSFWRTFETFSQNFSFGELETSSKGHASLRPFNAPISNCDRKLLYAKDGDFTLGTLKQFLKKIQTIWIGDIR